MTSATTHSNSLLNRISALLYMWQGLEAYCWDGVVTLRNLPRILQQQYEELPSQHLVCNFWASIFVSLKETETASDGFRGHPRQQQHHTSSWLWGGWWWCCRRYKWKKVPQLRARSKLTYETLCMYLNGLLPLFFVWKVRGRRLDSLLGPFRWYHHYYYYHPTPASLGGHRNENRFASS